MVHDISGDLEVFDEVRHHSHPHEAAELQIRDLIKNYAKAISEGDLAKIFSFYAQDVVAFDCPPPLEIQGAEAYAKNWDQYFISEFEFPVGYELQNEKIFATENLAFFHGNIHMHGTFKKSQKPTEAWLRISCGLRKFGDDWKIVHEHISVPVGNDMQAIMNMPPTKLAEEFYKANEEPH